jgi:hypothetical protein
MDKMRERKKQNRMITFEEDKQDKTLYNNILSILRRHSSSGQTAPIQRGTEHES